jgi:hypothetical protein
MKSNIVQAYYLNNVGALNIKIDLNEKKSDYVSLSHKCEDGNLSIILSYKGKQYALNVFLTKSMSVKFKETNGVISENMFKLRYSVTRELFANKAFEYPMLSVRDCIDFDVLEDISCIVCNRSLLNNILYNKIVSNFNYDYVDNLEILSCHEDDINNIIPNLDEKLKKL